MRHPNRETGLRCVRCDRPACSDCLREASVGYQCIDCVAEGTRSTRRATTVAGAEPADRAVLVPTLIAINVVVFLVTAFEANSVRVNFAAPLFQQWALVPAAVADGALWRLLTSGFLHVGPFHLIVNMLALWLIGRELELVLGRVRFLALYFVSLLGGSLFVFLFQDEFTRTAGASGAVFGLMGGLAVVLVRLRRRPGAVLTVIALNVVISVVIQLSLLGHLGGLVFGAAVAAGLVYAPRDHRLAVQAATVAGLLAVVLVGVVLGTAGAVV